MLKWHAPVSKDLQMYDNSRLMTNTNNRNAPLGCTVLNGPASVQREQDHLDRCILPQDSNGLPGVKKSHICVCRCVHLTRRGS